jgi:hypothetical protein
MLRHHSLLALAVIALVPIPSWAQTVVSGVLHGTVLGNSGSPLSGVRVVGSLRGVIRSETLTDGVGEFRLRWWRDSLPMSLSFRRIGVLPRSLSISEWPKASEGLRVALEDRAIELERTLIRAKPSRPIQDLAQSRLGPGATARTLDLTSGLSGDFTGDLASALAWIPGVFASPGGTLRDASIFGLGGADNGRTLNGQTAQGGALPRDGLTHSVRLSTYDPRQGRFAGAVITSEMQSGSFIQRRSGRVTFQPGVQPAAAGATVLVGPTPTNMIASGTLSGPLTADKTFFSFAGQVQQSTSRVATLSVELPDATALDSLRVIRDVADSLGLLTGRSMLPQVVQSSLGGSAVARVDLTPNAQATGDAQASVLYLLTAGSIDRKRNQGVGRTSTGEAATSSDRHDVSLQAVWAPYLRAALLDMRSRIGGGTHFFRSISTLPQALVSPLALGDGGSSLAQLGGAAQPNVRDQYLSWDIATDAAWRNTSGSHSYNAFAQFELHSREIGSTDGGSGVYLYPSLGAFRQNAPARFVGAASLPRVFGLSKHLALAVSDTWTPSAAGRNAFAMRPGGLVVQYGARAEADVVSLRGDADSAAQLGGSSSSRFTRLAILPMIGATWRATEVTRRVEGFPTTFHRHEFQAGIRRYRGGTSVLANSSLPFAAGLGQERFSEDCVGSAIRPPAWRGPADLTSGCDVAAGSQLASRTTSITALASAWEPPLSVRGEFRWSRRQSPAIVTDITATVAMNSKQAGSLDVNIRRMPTGRDTSEAGRPQYFDPAGVDQRTGTISITASREDVRLGRLINQLSAGQSRVGQLTAGMTWRPGATGSVRLDPIRAVNGQLRAAYTLTRGTLAGSGYTLGVTGAPDDVVRGRIANPTHAFVISGRVTLESWLSVQTALRVTSGRHFTPVYGADVNGDGLANDRIYVPDDAKRQPLLEALTHSGRRCLSQYSSRFVSVNGCAARWATSLAPILIELDPRRFRLGSRGNATIAMTNPLTALDRLLNGHSGKGWGASVLADPALLAVTGYDASTRAFRYAPQPSVSTSATGRALLQPPFGVTLDVRVDLSRNLETQRVEGFVRRGDAGGPLPPSQFRASLLRDAAAFSAEDILFISHSLDSLGCDSTQREQLMKISRRRLDERAALFGNLADEMSKRLSDLRSKELRNIWHATMIASLESSERATKDALKVLTPEQIGWLLRRDLLPSFRQPRGWLDRERRLPQLNVR